MKADIHPEYVLSTVHCSCGNSFVTRSTKPELHVEICAQCHPFYTGKQKLVDTGGRVERFQRRLEKAGRAQRSPARLTPMAQAIGGQAVLEGVMMRGPRNWAVAVRKPDGEIAHVCAHDRPAEGAPLVAAAPDRPRRRRARRVARDRLPRAVGLGELRRRRRRPRATTSPRRSAAGRSSSRSRSRSASR